MDFSIPLCTLDMSQHGHTVTQAYHLHTFHVLYCQMAMQVLLFSHLVLLLGAQTYLFTYLLYPDTATW